MATSEGIPSSIDIEFLELNDNPYFKGLLDGTISIDAFHDYMMQFPKPDNEM